MNNFYINKLNSIYNNCSYNKQVIADRLDRLTDLLSLVDEIEDQWLTGSRMYLSGGFTFKGYLYFWTIGGLKVKVEGRRLRRGENKEAREILFNSIIKALTLENINIFRKFYPNAPIEYLNSITYMVKGRLIDRYYKMLSLSNFGYLPPLFIEYSEIAELDQEIEEEERRERLFNEVGAYNYY